MIQFILFVSLSLSLWSLGMNSVQKIRCSSLFIDQKIEKEIKNEVNQSQSLRELRLYKEALKTCHRYMAISPTIKISPEKKIYDFKK